MRAEQAEACRLFDEQVERLVTETRIAAIDERAQPSNDRARSQRLCRRQVERLGDIGQQRVCAVIDHRARRLQVIGDRGQRLVDLVR